MASQKLPFNDASFDKVTRFGYTWVDKTRLIPLLESEDSSGCRSTEEALCRQLAETYKKFDFNSITNKSVLPPSVCLFYLNAWQRTQQPTQVPFESMNHIDSHYVIETKIRSSFVLGPIIELTQNCPPLR